MPFANGRLGDKEYIATSRPSLSLCLTALVALLCSTTTTASVHDPALRFRTFPTDHFVIYYHQGEDLQAARLATIAEDTWRRVSRLSIRPPKRTHVVLVDETELAGGWALVNPRNTIVVTAAWPAGFEFLGNTEDWLELVFTHEFTHIVHLDRSQGWAHAFRAVFGRIPIAFPNLFLPAWQVEGLATYEETALTGAGRLHAGDFQAILGEAARTRRLEPLDRVNGGLTDWPGGQAPYAYGAGFHAYLADRFGDDTLARLAERTAGRVPFTGSAAFKGVYGESLGALWRDFQARLTTSVSDSGPTGARQLTHHGFTVLAPRYARPGCETCARDVVYSVRTPDGFPTLNRLRIDGSAPAELTTRYLGSTSAVGRRLVVFDQQELSRNSALHSDLYALDLETGRVTRLTSGARLLEPDLSPDERTLVAVQQSPGRRALVLLALNAAPNPEPDITIVISEPDTQFNAPRWSPDGRLIAVERHRLGARSEIVVVDPALGTVEVIASFPTARVVTPAWRRNGRSIVASADLDGETFNLFEFSIDPPAPPRRLTRTTGGATWPDVSHDDESIVFVGYTPDGYDLFEMKLAEAPADARPQTPGQLFRPGAIAARAPSAERAGPAASGSGPNRDDSTTYSPWPTLGPTWWSPVVEGNSRELRLGAATAGGDVLGYHAYSMSATWLLSAPTQDLGRSRVDPDWQIAYAYDRWRLTLFVTASSATSRTGPSNGTGLLASGSLRERQLEVGALFPVRHVRTSSTMFLSVRRAAEEYTQADADVTRQHVASARGAWSVDSARTYGYSISREHGATFGTTAELVRQALGAPGDATSLTADGRVYLPSLAPHHVLALRAAAGTTSGDPALGRTFHFGGPASNAGVVSFDRRAISLLRGFPADTFAGRSVALMNADYRWPIARPQRGLGTWPLFLHTVHAAAFIDAGHAWDREFSLGDLQSSVGAELSVNVTAGYAFPLTATIGVSRGRDGSRSVADRTTLYLRIGRAF